MPKEADTMECQAGGCKYVSGCLIGRQSCNAIPCCQCLLAERKTDNERVHKSVQTLSDGKEI